MHKVVTIQICHESYPEKTIETFNTGTPVILNESSRTTVEKN